MDVKIFIVYALNFFAFPPPTPPIMFVSIRHHLNCTAETLVDGEKNEKISLFRHRWESRRVLRTRHTLSWKTYRSLRNTRLHCFEQRISSFAEGLNTEYTLKSWRTHGRFQSSEAEKKKKNFPQKWFRWKSTFRVCEGETLYSEINRECEAEEVEKDERERKTAENICCAHEKIPHSQYLRVVARRWGFEIVNKHSCERKLGGKDRKLNRILDEFTRSSILVWLECSSSARKRKSRWFFIMQSWSILNLDYRF